MKQFDGMTVEQLLEIKAKLEAEIALRVDQERKRLTASPERLESIGGASSSSHARDNGRSRRTLRPKYRNPDNPGQTWAGRGLKPRWLVSAMKDRKKKLSDFEIRS